MTVTVFGATGAIGQLVVDDLLSRGTTVRAYVRNPAKVPRHWHDRVDIVVGEMSERSTIDRAVAGSTAVISALGPSMDRKATGLPLVEGTRHIVESMKRHGVRRIIGQGTPSVLDRRDKKTVQARLVGFLGRTMLPRAYEELVAMSDIITESGLDWTIVRFIGPKDGPAKGVNHEGFFGTDKIGWAATRTDIAVFTAAQVDDTKYINAAPAISN